jgi:hypothetical protein
MKAKATIYKGHHFRSRTEARWAVFFDAMKLDYLYEHEDFMLPSGRYLPDFYLPEFEGGAFAEVKGEFNDLEYKKCSELCRLTRKPVLLLSGVPDFKCVQYYGWNERAFLECPKCFDRCVPYEGDKCEAVYGPSVEMYHGIINAWNKYGNRMYVFPGFEGDDLYFKENDWDEPLYRAAVHAARSARFEFGESGSTL